MREEEKEKERKWERNFPPASPRDGISIARERARGRGEMEEEGEKREGLVFGNYPVVMFNLECNFINSTAIVRRTQCEKEIKREREREREKERLREIKRD